ncbi:MAG: hypothetical protein ACP5GJ_00350 [Nanopusillaceae archaeon]|jgi:hypothetical protein
MRSFNISLFFEIIVVIIVLYFLLTAKYYSIMYLRGYEKEDLLSSLISINYLNLTNLSQLNQSLYEIVTNILPYYYVEINNQAAFYNINITNVTEGIKDFYIINGSIYYVYVYWK